jgi:AcrR family transcriptional regulator
MINLFKNERRFIIVQVLKEDLRLKIRSSAVEAFINHGYQKASMREIAEAADMSVGNLYRYFKNKEALFGHLVQPLIDAFLANQDREFEPKYLDVNFLEHSSIVEMLMNARIKYREELYILFLRSEGSPFEGAKVRLIEYIEVQIKKFLEDMTNDGEAVIKSPIFIKAAAASIVESFCVILENAKDDQGFIYSMLEMAELIIKPALRNLVSIRNNETKFRRINDEEVLRFYRSFSNHSSNCSA